MLPGRCPEMPETRPLEEARLAALRISTFSCCIAVGFDSLPIRVLHVFGKYNKKTRKEQRTWKIASSWKSRASSVCKKSCARWMSKPSRSKTWLTWLKKRRPRSRATAAAVAAPVVVALAVAVVAPAVVVAVAPVAAVRHAPWHFDGTERLIGSGKKAAESTLPGRASL